MRITIPMVQAALGAEIEIEGIFEDERFTVPSPRDRKRPGHSRSRLRHAQASQRCSRRHVRTHRRRDSQTLSKREREILEELAEEMGEEVTDKRSPLQKLRDIFD